MTPLVRAMRRAGGGVRRLLSVAVLGIAAARVGAQSRPAESRLVVQVRPETVTVGQPFEVRLRLQSAPGALVRFPELPDTGDAIEALDPRMLDDARSADRDGAGAARTASYRLVAWDVGARTPRFAPVVVTVDGEEARFDVRIPPVIVRSLLPTDSAERVARPARGLVPVDSGLWRLVLLLAVLALVLGVWWWRQRPRALREATETEAWAESVRAFAALEALALHEAGEPARHVIAHVDVMRDYLERRFPRAHAAQTPAEFAAALAGEEFPARHDRVAALVTADAALRFSDGTVDRDQAQALAEEARRIVRDVQDAHEARLRAADRGPQRPRRR